ncbi:MAG: hypothetical protein D6767_07650 [Candidatus Hydrogenedentota bacterium]|nr:MAG: hypothetical protein D6767_07650 [Candidatus Hydrogenedentota bacterium]
MKQRGIRTYIKVRRACMGWTMNIVVCAAAIFFFACVNAKPMDPGLEDHDPQVPVFTSPVSVQKLTPMTASDIDSLKNGQELETTNIIYQICPSCCLSCQYEQEEASPKQEVTSSFVDSDPCIDNVVSQFQDLPIHGSKISANASISYVHPDQYTEKVDNLFGLDNHIQGVVRLRNGPYLAVTGSDPPADSRLPSWLAWIFDYYPRVAGDLWIVRLDSKSQKGSGRWGTNETFSVFHLPHPWDTIVLPIEIGNKDHWHPGGLGTEGDILAVPLTGYHTLFFYMDNPENPKKIAYEMPVAEGAVDLVKLSNGYYLIAFEQFTFYLSNSTNIANGFSTSGKTVPISTPSGGEFQSFSFIKQCDGKLYLAGFENTGSAAPTFGNGEDWGRLYEVNLSGTGLLNNPPSFNAAPSLTLKAEKKFICYEDGKYCNFDAAGNLYIDPATKKLILYGVYHFRTSDERLRFREF